VICAINGACAGIGLVTALMCDVRFAARMPDHDGLRKRGLPAEEAVSWIMPRIVGHGAALGSAVVRSCGTWCEAAAIGLVHWAVPREELLERTASYARDMAAHCFLSGHGNGQRQVYRDWCRPLAESSWSLANWLALSGPHQRIFAKGCRALWRSGLPRSFLIPKQWTTATTPT